MARCGCFMGVKLVLMALLCSLPLVTRAGMVTNSLDRTGPENYPVDGQASLPHMADSNAVGAMAKSVIELPKGSAPLVAEAQRYFSAGQYDKAEADYREILKSDPSNAPVLANLAAIELQEQKVADAETHITAALLQRPEDAYNLLVLGEIKFHQDKFDDALDTLERAAKLDPQNPEIQNFLGVTLAQKGMLARAETALRNAIQLDPNYAAAHNNLAVTYLGEKPPLAGLARWHYQKALDNGQPRNPDLEKLLADKGAPVNPQ